MSFAVDAGAHLAYHCAEGNRYRKQRRGKMGNYSDRLTALSNPASPLFGRGPKDSSLNPDRRALAEKEDIFRVFPHAFDKLQPLELRKRVHGCRFENKGTNIEAGYGRSIELMLDKNFPQHIDHLFSGSGPVMKKTF